MATVASLQIKIGADVSAAINGLSKAEFAATKVKEAYIEANDATVRGGFAIAGWAQNFSTAIKGVQQNLKSIDLSKLDDDARTNTSNMLSLASGALRASESVTVAASAFSGMQSIAGPALAGIAKLIPSIGVSLAALAGPIGLVVGALAAGAALIVSNWDLVEKAISDVDNITLQANNGIVEQDSKMRKLVATINDNTKSYKERNGALQEAQSIAGTYFGTLDIEKLKVDDVNIAYTKYVDNLKKASLAKELSSEIEKETLKLIELEKKFNERLSKGSGFQFQLPGTTQIDLNDLVTGSFVGINKDVQETTKKIDELRKRLSEQDFTVEGKSAGKSSKTKDVETEAEKIQGVLQSLEKKLQLIQEEFKAGIIPDDFAAQVDAIQGAISQIGSINPNSTAFKQLIEDYKQLANQNPVELAVAFNIDLKKVEIASLNELPDRVKDVTAKMNASFSKINFAESFEAKAAATKLAVTKQLEEIGKVVSTAAGVFGNAISVIGEFDQASFANREATVDAYYAKQKDYIEKSISDEGLKGKKMEALEKEVAAKRRAIKRDEAAANKRSAIFSAIINTARAIAESLPNIALSVAAGALGAAQVAAIASTPLPALQAGGLVSGRNTVVVGEYAGADNNPELISPVNKVKKYIAEAVIESGGGGITQLVSYISGDDLVLISERGQYRKNRLG